MDLSSKINAFISHDFCNCSSFERVWKFSANCVPEKYSSKFRSFDNEEKSGLLIVDDRSRICVDENEMRKRQNKHRYSNLKMQLLVFFFLIKWCQSKVRSKPSYAHAILIIRINQCLHLLYDLYVQK